MDFSLPLDMAGYGQKKNGNDVKHILASNISFPRNARGSNYCSCQESTSCSWLFTITDATNCLLAPVWVSSCQKRVLTAHDRIHILSTKTNSADCQHYLHTIVYTDLLTIPSTRMKSSYLKWDMSIPNKYGLTFCWTSWNKNIQVWRRSQQRNHWCTIYIFLTLQTRSKPCSSFWRT